MQQSSSHAVPFRGFPQKAFLLHQLFSVLTNVNTDATVFKEEIFGSCAAVARFEGEAEAIETANASR